jgi:hypothetical protein
MVIVSKLLLCIHRQINVSKYFSFKLSKASFLQCSNISYASSKIVKTVMINHMTRNVIAIVIFDWHSLYQKEFSVLWESGEKVLYQGFAAGAPFSLFPLPSLPQSPSLFSPQSSVLPVLAISRQATQASFTQTQYTNKGKHNLYFCFGITKTRLGSWDFKRILQIIIKTKVHGWLWTFQRA